LKRNTFKYIEDILRDYPNIDQHIKERELALRYSTQPADENVGGGRAQNKYTQPVLNMLITIDEDTRLTALKNNQKAINDILDESGIDTITIINELYFKKRPVYTMNGLVENNLISVGKSKAYDLRNNFFENLARKLGLIS
jgi:RinA family phage transcriptional activator